LIDGFPARPTDYARHTSVTLIKLLLILNDGRPVESAVLTDRIENSGTEEGGRMADVC
jgi:hypothetical protein